MYILTNTMLQIRTVSKDIPVILLKVENVLEWRISDRRSFYCFHLFVCVGSLEDEKDRRWGGWILSPKIWRAAMFWKKYMSKRVKWRERRKPHHHLTIKMWVIMLRESEICVVPLNTACNYSRFIQVCLEETEYSR